MIIQNYISEETIKILEEKYKVKIHYDIENYTVDNIDSAYCAGDDIYLFKYTSDKIESICLCHEIAHCIISRKFKGKYHITKLSSEGAAWEETINVLKDNEQILGIEFDIDNYNSEEYNFMKKCFLSYCKEENMQ